VGGSKLPLVAAALVAAAVVGYFTFGPKPQPPAEPVLTVEAKTYLRNLALSDVGMEAADSYIKTSLVQIKGKLTNNGQKTVSGVQVSCVFRDVNGQVIKRERVTIAGSKTGPLPPGATKTFELNFDNIPEAWNQAMPDLVIAEIRFG
jgi:hypothetical protein